MKKHLLTFLIFSLAAFTARQAKAQFPGGFFNQQSTKEKLMAEQVAGYQVYLSAIKTGYNIAGKGLTTAHDLKNGTFVLHTDYINSLKQVASAIRKDPKAGAVDSLYQQIRALFASGKQWQARQRLLSATELQYFNKVNASLLAQSKTDMDELGEVLTPGKLQLTDAQRLDRLDKLYERMKDKYVFAGYFTGKCRRLALNRQKQQKDGEQIRKLYGIQ
jgi:hypothetical protein